MLLLSSMIYAIIYFDASQLAYVFNSERNETLQSFAVMGLKLYFIACPFIGFNIVLSTYLISTKGLFRHRLFLCRGDSLSLFQWHFYSLQF